MALLGDPSLSVHQLCLVYLGVAALYAGGPMAAAAYAWPGRIDGSRAGLLAAAVFVVLAAPTLVLHVGVQEWFLAATLVVGAAVGSLAGGAGGGWFRTRRQVAGG